MTSEPPPGGPPSLADSWVGADGPETTVVARPAGLWRPDTSPGGTAGGRQPAARRLRAGCLALVVVLLLICCVLGAWLADAVLDLRVVTTTEG